jgi:hypothetical protein
VVINRANSARLQPKPLKLYEIPPRNIWTHTTENRDLHVLQRYVESIEAIRECSLPTRAVPLPVDSFLGNGYNPVTRDDCTAAVVAEVDP